MKRFKCLKYFNAKQINYSFFHLKIKSIWSKLLFLTIANRLWIQNQISWSLDFQSSFSKGIYLSNYGQNKESLSFQEATLGSRPPYTKNFMFGVSKVRGSILLCGLGLCRLNSLVSNEYTGVYQKLYHLNLYGSLRLSYTTN